MVLDPNPVGVGSSTRATGGFRTQFASHLNIQLSLASRPFFETRSSRLRFHPNGYVYLARDARSVKQLEEWGALQRREGLPIENVDASTMFGGLIFDDVLAANYCHLDGAYDPKRVLDTYIEEARDRGATFHYERDIDEKWLAAETVVVAAGVWSADLGRRLGVKLEIEAVPRTVWAFGPVSGISHSMPVGVDVSGGWVFRERDGSLLVVPPPGDPENRETVREWIGQHLASPRPECPASHWTGFYEVTFDHHPFVGLTSRKNVWASCGFSGHGIMHSPAISDCLAAMILGDTPPIDISALSPLRTTALQDPTQV